jgi:hypothetical protein
LRGRIDFEVEHGLYVRLGFDFTLESTDVVDLEMNLSRVDWLDRQS